jgi:transmembrane serine protease 3
MRPLRKFDPEGQRIVGGVEVRPGSHPWIVSMQQYDRHFCGGTLIRVGSREESDIVVTAAHCVYDGISGLSIIAGAHNHDYPEKGQQSVRGVREVMHPQYDPVTTINDIAIIKLEKPIKFSPTVQPACLPQPGENVPDNAQGIVAGWGYTREGAYETSRILMQVGVPVVNGQTCVSNYRSTGMLISPKEMLCAGYSYGGKDSCQGDSGGPLVFQSGQGYVLQGVVSFGEGCAQPGKPGVYARVSNYISWINSQVKSLSSLSG